MILWWGIRMNIQKNFRQYIMKRMNSLGIDKIMQRAHSQQVRQTFSVKSNTCCKRYFSLLYETIIKDDVGGYAYGGANPYAVTALGPDNAVAAILTDQSVAYTPFDKVASVIQDGKTLMVGYGIDRQRVVQTLMDGNTRRTKRYFTPLYETVTEIHAFGATRRTSAMKTDND